MWSLVPKGRTQGPPLHERVIEAETNVLIDTIRGG